MRGMDGPASDSTPSPADTDGLPAGPALLRAPLVPVALAMVGGIVAGVHVPASAGLWAVVAAAGLVAAIVTFRRAHLNLASCLAVGAAIFAGSAVHGKGALFSVERDHVATLCPPGGMLATIRGQVVTHPYVYAGGAEGPFHYPRPPRTSFVVSAGAILTRAGWQAAAGLVRVGVDEPAGQVRAGREVELTGWLGRIGPPANPGQYDWSAAAARDGARVRMKVPAGAGVIAAPEPDWSWLDRLVWRVRTSAREHLAASGDVDSARLVNALVLGDRHPALRRLNEVMVRAGVAHLISISGMHLGIFAGFVFLVCRLLMLTPRRAAGVALTVLAAYLLLAESRSPLLRSAVMWGAMCVAVLLHRRVAAINSLAAAAVVLLAVEPLQLFATGFQLSFATVGAVLLGHRRVRQMLFGRYLRTRGLMVFREERRVRRWLRRRAADVLMDAVVVAVTAYAAAVPLVAYHFGLFSPYAPLLSLLLVPVLAGVLVPGYLSVALAWPMPNLAASLGDLAAQVAGWMAGAVEWLSVLPGLCLELRPVGLPWVAAAYGAMVLVVLAGRLRHGRLLAGAAVAVLAAATAWTQRPAPVPAGLELDVLAVGAGQCAVLRTPAGRTVLLDAGTKDSFDAWQHVLEPFCRHRRLPVPSVAFVSHANTDHYNALPGLLARHDLRRVYLCEYFTKPLKPDPVAAEMVALLGRHGVGPATLRAGDAVDLGGQVRVEVLWPPARRRDDLSVNDTSLVLRITCGGRSILVPGDLEEAGQAALAALGARVRSDVLVLPHHGSWKRTLPAFVEAVRPRVVVVSSARRPSAPLSAGEAGEGFYRDLSAGREYYCTADDGWVHVALGPAGVRVRTMRQLRQGDSARNSASAGRVE